jgi:uncharacterized RDD family membrane protein YckC
MPEIAWPHDAPPATRWRRFFGHLLEALLIGLLLVVGWLIWLWFSAKKSQSPAKQLLGMYIISTDGQPISAPRVWIREALLQWLIFANVFLATIVDFLFFLFDANAQSLHDKIMETAVVRPLAQPRSPTATQSPPHSLGGGTPPDTDRASPYGADLRAQERKLRELEELADNGLITIREYRDRRRRMLEEIDGD